MNPANAYRNGPLYAAYTAVAMKGLIDLEQSAGVNLIAMLSWSFEFEGKDYFEGFRTLATNGVDKPILNVFRMAGLMSGDRVATDQHRTGSAERHPVNRVCGRQPDIDAFATKAAHEAAVMLWNYHDDDVPAPDRTCAGHDHGHSCGREEGSARALSHRRDAQQLLYRVEGDGLAAIAHTGAIRAVEGSRTTGAADLSGMARRKRRQSCD